MWTCLNLYKLLVLFDSKSTYRPNILSPWYYFFLRSEIGIFNNFVKTVDLVKNTGTWTRRQSLSTGTLHTSSSLIQWNIEVCFLHYSLLIQSLSCIKCFNWEGLPFWNREKERTGSTFLNLLQGNSLHLFSSLGISCSETAIEQVEFSLLPLSSISLIPIHEGDLLLVCSSKCWNSLLKRYLDELYSVTPYHWQNILV